MYEITFNDKLNVLDQLLLNLTSIRLHLFLQRFPFLTNSSNTG